LIGLHSIAHQAEEIASAANRKMSSRQKNMQHGGMKHTPVAFHAFNVLAEEVQSSDDEHFYHSKRFWLWQVFN